LGDTEKAVRHFSEAVRIKPDYLKAQYSLGAMLEQQGKLDDALLHYAEVLRIAPDFPEKARLEKLLNEKKQGVEKKDG
jgi:tetratricopeptide (TPR) repeat protein